MLTYHQISLKLLFPYKLSNKKYKPVKHRVIGSFFRRQQLIKDRGTQIGTPPIYIGLNEFDHSYARLWCEFFLLLLLLLKVIYKHRASHWLVKENKFGAATFD